MATGTHVAGHGHMYYLLALKILIVMAVKADRVAHQELRVLGRVRVVAACTHAAGYRHMRGLLHKRPFVMAHDTEVQT
jgi:hypothetical protein